MTNDLPAGLTRHLARLGRVAPPQPAVLDAARERLWAAVAAEMLATGPAGETADPGARQAADPGARQAADPGARMAADPDRPGLAGPGA